jgi:hypothetical protein
MSANTRWIGRENVLKLLDELAELSGRSLYSDGVCRLELADELIEIRPAFGLDGRGDEERLELQPLRVALERDYLVGVVICRLGGYAVGVFAGERLLASKVGSRFVKNRHKKGGSSQGRFRRRRDEQAQALLDEAAEVAGVVFEPFRGRLEWLAFGGDRLAIKEVLVRRPGLGALAPSLKRLLNVDGSPRLKDLETLPYQLYSAEVWRVPREPS